MGPLQPLTAPAARVSLGFPVSIPAGLRSPTRQTGSTVAFDAVAATAVRYTDSTAGHSPALPPLLQPGRARPRATSPPPEGGAVWPSTSHSRWAIGALAFSVLGSWVRVRRHNFATQVPWPRRGRRAHHAYLLVPCAVLHAAPPLRLLSASAATQVRRHHEAVPCGPVGGRAGNGAPRREGDAR